MQMYYTDRDWIDAMRKKEASKKAVPGQKKFKKKNTAITPPKVKRK